MGPGWVGDPNYDTGVNQKYVSYNDGTGNGLDFGQYFPDYTPQMQVIASPTVLRWTAPGAGTVTVNVTFEAVCTQAGNYQTVSPYAHDPEVEVFQNATLVNASSASEMDAYTNTHNYTGTLTVAPGDTFDFVGFGSTVSTLTSNVAISGTITFTPVPEPSSIALLVCGLAALLAYAWRKRR